MDGRHLEPGFRMHQGHGGLRSLLRGTPRPAGPGGARDRKRGVEGKRVEFGGGRSIKKKKKRKASRGIERITNTKSPNVLGLFNCAKNLGTSLLICKKLYLAK